MNTKKIILVDDDTDLGNLVSSCLIADGYTVHYQTSLLGIENNIEDFKPEILVLDVEIGEEDGVAEAKNILQKFPLLNILFISSHTETSDIVRGLISGGVGYIRKPFDMQELKAYIERFSFTVKTDGNITRFGCYSLNRQTRELHLDDILIKRFSRLEFNVLLTLIESGNNLTAYESLSRKAWNRKHGEIEHSLNNTIAKIRKVLDDTGKASIQTVKGVGYILHY